MITYIFDYLMRKQGLTLEEAAGVVAAPFWDTIGRQSPEKQAELTYLRDTFAPLLITGPFSILLSFDGGMMALNDRLKLRSMVVAEKGDMFYAASEECAIRVKMCIRDRGKVGRRPVADRDGAHLAFREVAFIHPDGFREHHQPAEFVRLERYTLPVGKGQPDRGGARRARRVVGSGYGCRHATASVSLEQAGCGDRVLLRIELVDMRAGRRIVHADLPVNIPGRCVIRLGACRQAVSYTHLDKF